MEILFRGKRVDNGEWVEGYYSKRFFITTGREITFITFRDGDYLDVISETVGQYTGLKDKNGVKIFTGDILQLDTFLVNLEKVKSANSEHTIWYEVFWNQEYSNWSLKAIKTTRRNNFGLGQINNYKINMITGDMEVVGNKWDNADLMGVGK